MNYQPNMKLIMCVLVSVLVMATVTTAVECGTVPTVGCTLSASTTFVPNTYYLNGSSTGALIINAHNIVVDCNGSTFIGNSTQEASNRCFYGDLKNNITIENCNISTYERAINIRRSPDLKLINNTINNSEFGINFENNLNFIVNNSYFFSSERYPFYIYSGSYGYMNNNYFSNNLKVVGNLNTQQGYVINSNITIFNSTYNNFGGAILYATNATVNILDSNFSNINGTINAFQSILNIAGSTFYNFTSSQPSTLGISMYENIFAYQSVVNITGNTFNKNLIEEAVYLRNSSGIVHNNTFYDINRHAVACNNCSGCDVQNNYLQNVSWNPALIGKPIDMFGLCSNHIVARNIINSSYEGVVFSCEETLFNYNHNITSSNNTVLDAYSNNIDYGRGFHFHHFTNFISTNDYARNISGIALKLQNVHNGTITNMTLLSLDNYSFYAINVSNVIISNSTFGNNIGIFQSTSTDVTFSNVNNKSFYLPLPNYLKLLIDNNYIWFDAYDTYENNISIINITSGWSLYDITTNQYLWTSTGPGNDEYNITLAAGQEVQIQDYGMMVLNIDTTDPTCSNTYNRTEAADPDTPWCTLEYACDQRLGGDVLILDGVSGAQTMCPTTVLGWGSEFDPFAIIVPFFGLIIVLIFGIVIYKAFQGDELDLDFLKDNLMQILLIGLMLCIAIILFGAIASLIISYL
jgi:hypothetical protein